jgi:hypothetical protein
MDFSAFRTNKCAVGEVTDDQRQQAKQVRSFLKEHFNKITTRKPIVKLKVLLRASLFNFRSDKSRFFFASINFLIGIFYGSLNPYMVKFNNKRCILVFSLANPFPARSFIR